jgi:hypothetical protein
VDRSAREATGDADAPGAPPEPGEPGQPGGGGALTDA